MPIVPIQSAQQISTDVPGVASNPLQSAGQTGNALQVQGDALAAQGFNLLQKKKEAEAVSTSSEAHAQDMLDSQSKYSDLVTSSPDGYALDDDGAPKLNPDGSRRTITEEYRDWADDRFKSTQLNMPTQLAQQMYQTKARTFYTDQMLAIQKDEDLISARASKASDSKILQGFADNLVSAADVNSAYQYSNTLSSSIMDKAGSVYTHPEAQTEIMTANQQLAESTIKGAFNQVLSDSRSGGAAYNRTGQVDYWRSVLGGEDPVSQGRKKMGLPTISDMLKPDDKARLDEEFIRLKAQAHDLDMSAFHSTVKDAVAAYQSGYGNRVDAAGLRGQVDTMVAAGKLQANEGADLKAQLVAAQGIGALNSASFALASPAQQAAAVDSASKRIYGAAQASGGNRVAGSAAQAAFEGQAATVLQQSLSAKRTDFAAYAESSDPSIQASMARVDFSNPQSLQDKAQQIQGAIAKTQVYYDQNFPGQPQFARVITKDRSKMVGNQLSDPNFTAQQTADAVTALKKAYGSYYPSLVSQMVDDGNLDASWRIAGFLSPGLQTQDVVGALKGSKDTDKNFKVVAESKGVKDTDFDKAVATQSAPWISTLTSQRPNDALTNGNTAALQATVKNKAKQLYIESGGSIEPEDAAKKAVQSMLSQNAYLEQVAPGSRSSLVMIPKYSGSSPINDLERDNVLQYMNGHGSTDSLKAFGVQAPPTSGKLAPENQAKATDAFLQQASRTGRWSLADDHQGYNFYYQDDRSGRDVLARVPNPKGGLMPLYVPLATMTAPTPGKAAQPRLQTFSPLEMSK